MSDLTIVDNEYITMKYLADKKTIYHVVHQPINGAPLREALLKGFNALHDYGATKWLSDDRKNGPMSKEDEDWNRENLNRGLVGTEWKYWALIVPEVVVAAGAMVQTMEELHAQGLRMMVFSDVEAGFEWLDQFED